MQSPYSCWRKPPTPFFPLAAFLREERNKTHRHMLNTIDTRLFFLITQPFDASFITISWQLEINYAHLSSLSHLSSQIHIHFRAHLHKSGSGELPNEAQW